MDGYNTSDTMVEIGA